MVQGEAGGETGLSHVAVVIQHLPRDTVVKEARGSFQGGVALNACKVQVLLFMDDTALVADVEEDLKHGIAAIQEVVREHKLGINWGKTNTGGEQGAWSV